MDQLPGAIKISMRPATVWEEIKGKTETKEKKLQINVRGGNRARDSQRKKKERKKQNNMPGMKAHLKDMLAKLKPSILF